MVGAPPRYPNLVREATQYSTAIAYANSNKAAGSPLAAIRLRPAVAGLRRDMSRLAIYAHSGGVGVDLPAPAVPVPLCGITAGAIAMQQSRPPLCHHTPSFLAAIAARQSLRRHPPTGYVTELAGQVLRQALRLFPRAIGVGRANAFLRFPKP